MKNNLKLFLILLALCLVVSGCHFPKINKAEPTAVPAEPENTEAADEEMLIHNNNTGSGPEGAGSEEDMLIHNNSGAPAPETAPEAAPQEDNGEMIVRPSSSIPIEMKTAGLHMMSRAGSIGAAQVQGGNQDIIIRNDQNITYQQNQPIIQKSAPSGQLQPLGYIPPQQLGNGQSIMFGMGETSAVVSGYVPAGGVVSYNLYAFANQNFLVLLSSDSGTSVLSITDVYGNVFLDRNQRQTSHNMYLPRTATYYVNVYSTGYAENFTLQVFIPARVTIPVGQTSVAYNGSIGPYGVVGYTAYMYAGQTARIDDYSGPQPTSFLRVSGLQTGVVYMDYTAYSPSWYSVVPATQDYLIEVISINQPSNYRLTVDVR